MSLIFNGNADLDSVVYNGNEVDVVMCDGAEVWRRIKSVSVPKLSGTSFKTKGTATGPTVSGYDSSIMTQEGTVSTNVPGTYEVKWTLKDTSKYCWSDGTTGAKKASWTLEGDTISITWAWSESFYKAGNYHTASLAYKAKWSDYSNGATYKRIAGVTFKEADTEILFVGTDNILYVGAYNEKKENYTSFKCDNAGAGPTNGGVYYGITYAGAYDVTM